MVTRPTISTLWIGGALSYLELLSLKSMQDWGHEVKLYHYEPLTNVPDWLNTYDANTIMPMSKERLERFATSRTIIANLFRYHLLAKTNEIWCDCDVYFIRPLPDQEIILVEESRKPRIYWNNSLLRLPSDSPVLAEIMELLSTDTPTLPDSPYFFDNNKSKKSDLDLLGGNGNVHLSDLAWGTSGPRSLSHFASKYKMQKYGWPSHIHQPFLEMQIGYLARPFGTRNLKLPLKTQSIHYYGSKIRHLLISADVFKNNEPLKGSFLESRLEDHGIDPKDAPLVSAVGKRSHINARNSKLDNLSKD